MFIDDFNAKRKGRQDNIVDNFGLGARNERDDHLVQFCKEQNLVLCNIFFELPPRQLYMWRTSDNFPGHIIQNQIDFIAISSRFRKSDHNPLICKFNAKTKKITKTPTSIQIDMKRLNNDECKHKVKESLQHDLKRVISSTDEPLEKWTKLNRLYNDYTGYNRNTRNKKW